MSERNPTNDGSASSLEVYAPIFRDGQVERAVIESFGGFRQFQTDDTLDLMPIVEVTEPADLENLDEYAQTGTPVLVDVPEYLTQTDEPNKYTTDISELISSSGGSVDFLNRNADEIRVPVVSGPLETSFDYSKLSSRYHNLSTDFDKAAIRIFCRSTEIDSTQRSDLQKLNNDLAAEDIVLIDSIEPTTLGPSTPGRENLLEIAEIFNEHQRIILDAFSVFRGENYNFGPEIARQAGIEGFGDFAHDRRYPPADDIPMGAIDTRNIYHYDSEERQQRKFQGHGYSGSDSAFEDMSNWDKWNPNHCQFCEDAEQSDSEGPTFWKGIRMGHYIESVLNEEA